MPEPHADQRPGQGDAASLAARDLGRGARRPGPRGPARPSAASTASSVPGPGRGRARPSAATVVPSGARVLGHPGDRGRAAGRRAASVDRRRRRASPCPASGVSAPRSTSSSVDLPAPLGPVTATTRPVSTAAMSAPAARPARGRRRRRRVGRAASRRPAACRALGPDRQGQGGRDLVGGVDAGGRGVERRADPPHRQQALGSEQQHDQRRLQVDAAAGQPDAERHGDEGHATASRAARAPGPTGTRPAASASWPAGTARSPAHPADLGVGPAEEPQRRPGR